MVSDLGSLHADARHRLAQAGIADAALDARLLVEQITGTSRTDLLARAEMPVGEAAAAALDAAIARRIAGEPVHRILGSRGFYGLDLALSADTLEPRPDTEVLVDMVAPHLRRIARERQDCHILDLGTGTGAIGLALVHEEPLARATLTDISPDALATARANADALGVGGRVETVLSDWFAAVEGRFDVIVSNPPYIPTADIEGLAVEVRRFDPMRALDGGADGLDAYRALAAGVSRVLAPDGLVGVEIGVGQAASAVALFTGQGLEHRETVRDLGGIERALLFAAPRR